MVGTGYVGVPLALRYAAVGYRVLGLDIDQEKVQRLVAGDSYIEHIPSAKIAEANKQGFETTTDFSCACEAGALILSAPAPLKKYHKPDLSFVTSTADALVPYLRKGQVLSLESDTSEGESLPRAESTDLKVGKDIFLVYPPERQDPTNRDFETRAIPKVGGGLNKACLEVGNALSEPAVDNVVPVSATRVAEMTKLLENIHITFGSSRPDGVQKKLINSQRLRFLGWEPLMIFADGLHRAHEDYLHARDRRSVAAVH